jgi:hypothetical protein
VGFEIFKIASSSIATPNPLNIDRTSKLITPKNLDLQLTPPNPIPVKSSTLTLNFLFTFGHAMTHNFLLISLKYHLSNNFSIKQEKVILFLDIRRAKNIQVSRIQFHKNKISYYFSQAIFIFGSHDFFKFLY